jgi:hypothetical protein
MNAPELVVDQGRLLLSKKGDVHDLCFTCGHQAVERAKILDAQ